MMYSGIYPMPRPGVRRAFGDRVIFLWSHRGLGASWGVGRRPNFAVLGRGAGDDTFAWAHEGLTEVRR